MSTPRLITHTTLTTCCLKVTKTCVKASRGDWRQLSPPGAHSLQAVGQSLSLPPQPWGTLWWLGSRDDCSGISQAVESPRRRCQNDIKAHGNGQPCCNSGTSDSDKPFLVCVPNKGTAEAQWPFFLQPLLSKTHFSLHSPLPKHLTAFNSALCCCSEGRAPAF